MVARLKKAFEKANKLPAAAQEQLAEQLLEEIEGETKWDDTLAASQPLGSTGQAGARRKARGNDEGRGL